MEKLIAAGLVVVGVLGVLLLWGLLMCVPAALVMLAWNALVPSLWDDAPSLAFWQAWLGLFIVGVIGRRLMPSVTVRK